MKIFNRTRNTVLASHASLADNFVSRLVGLLNRKNLSSGEALVIDRCSQIHMLFMRFAIDVVFVDKNNCVVGLTRNIKPYCLSPIFWHARQAIELPIGIIDQTQTTVGDEIDFLK